MSHGRVENATTRDMMMSVEKNLKVEITDVHEDVSNLREEFFGFGQQFSTILSMFLGLPNASLPMDFPLRVVIALILAGVGIHSHTLDPLETEDRLEFIARASTIGGYTG